MIEVITHPAFGAEMAVEFRQYFQRSTFKNFNIGFYTGIVCMRAPYFYRGKVVGHSNSIGFVPGIKFTYKKQINPWLVGEPYFSISSPWYANDILEVFQWMSHSDLGLIFTLGLKVGFNKVKNKKNE